MLIPDEEYRICIKNLPIVTVDLLIFNAEKNKTLLFQRNNEPLRGEYFSVGGRVLKNEPIDKAILRKTKEELGLDLNFEDLIAGGYVDEIFENSLYDDLGLHSLNIFFGYIAKNGDLEFKLDNQHSEGKWFNTDDESITPVMLNKINLMKAKI